MNLWKYALNSFSVLVTSIILCKAADNNAQEKEKEKNIERESFLNFEAHCKTINIQNDCLGMIHFTLLCT